MPDLIPFATRQLGNETVPTVNARDLHEFLGPKSRFNDWIAIRIKQYGFKEERDFTVLKNQYGPNSPQIEYFLTIGMAKELSMVERTKKGKEARQYFLDCEAQLHIRQPLQPSVQNQALQAIIDMAVQLDRTEQRAMLAEATATRAESKADMALNSQEFYTIAEYIYFNGLQRQLPESGYRAASDHLRLYCLDHRIPFRKQLVGGKHWSDEYAYHISTYHAALTPWLSRRDAQSNLRVLPPKAEESS